MKMITAGDSFLFGSKDKLWIVFNDSIETTIQEFKNYHINRFTTTIDNNIEEIYSLGRNYPIDFINSPREISASIDIVAQDISYSYKGNNSPLTPVDFYSIPELIKLSKIITKKFSEINKGGR